VFHPDLQVSKGAREPFEGVKKGLLQAKNGGFLGFLRVPEIKLQKPVDRI
jgi:hypothetical protein